MRTIIGYLYTLLPLAPLSLLPIELQLLLTYNSKAQTQAQTTVQADIRLNEQNYNNIYGLSHSFGGTIALESLKCGNTKLRFLVGINLRVPTNEFENLEKDKIVGRVICITTSDDTPGYPGKASFDKGYIHIINAEIKGWETSMDIRHNFLFFALGSTLVVAKIGGKTKVTDIRSLLNLYDYPTEISSHSPKVEIKELPCYPIHSHKKDNDRIPPPPPWQDGGQGGAGISNVTKSLKHCEAIIYTSSTISLSSSLVTWFRLIVVKALHKRIWPETH